MENKMNRTCPWGFPWREEYVSEETTVLVSAVIIDYTPVDPYECETDDEEEEILQVRKPVSVAPSTPRNGKRVVKKAKMPRRKPELKVEEPTKEEPKEKVRKMRSDRTFQKGQKIQRGVWKGFRLD